MSANRGRTPRQYDPEVRAARRQRQREAAERGSVGSATKRTTTGLAEHGSNGRSRKAAREGTRRMESEGPT
jgi:hypothetical protein